MREITYAQAISEATVQALEKNPDMFVIGEGVDDPVGIFGTTREAYVRFGSKRVMDMPIAENGMTGIALGTAVMGMHPLLVHARADFILLAMDQMINHAAKWNYMYGGKMSAPLTIRAIIGRGWGQGPQHSQSLQSLFVHIPGLKVVMPTTPYDAKGLLIACLEDKNPTIFIEHRSLYKEKGEVPEECYSLPLGKARIRKVGQDLTIVGISYGVIGALQASEILKKYNVDVEVIDLVSLKPWDKEMILSSLEKTGRLMIVDTDWKMCGMSSEISAVMAEEGWKCLRAPIKRVGLAESPAPTSYKLEEFYYPSVKEIVDTALSMLGKNEQKEKLVLENGENKKIALTIIVPALNEQNFLRNTIESILKCAPEHLQYEIIIINDGSTDDTGKIAECLAKEFNHIKVTHHDYPQNIGACFRRGVQMASGEYAVMLPGDDETHVDTIKNILNAVGTADVVTTYTVNKEVRGFFRRVISFIYTFSINILFNLRMKYFNGPTLVRVDLLKKLPPIPDCFAYMTAISVRLIKAGHGYKEIEMVIKPSLGRKSRALRWNNLKQVVKTVVVLFVEVNIKKKYFHEK